ncbi:hypothetical protein AB4Y32_31140 [Paraburkholderia phymatum]|uniref:Uncharacterized protein n=1 Tax=Paraburkholderia phymatum TaxID=148447 RepID=A0ACC6U917_9BURK
MGFYNMIGILMLAPALGLIAALLIKWESVGATIEESDGQHRADEAVLEGNNLADRGLGTTRCLRSRERPMP